jgi:hypothetical protein
VAAVVLSLFALLVCLSLSAWAQQKIPPTRSVVSPLQPVGPDCTTITGNLITNCGFETGDFTGWDVLDSGNMRVFALPNNGSFAAALGSVSHPGCIGQTLATNPGQAYTLSFALLNSTSPNNFSNNFYVLHNGVAVSGDMQNMPDFGYTQYMIRDSMRFVAVGNDSVHFCARNDPNFFFLDDVIFQLRQ